MNSGIRVAGLAVVLIACWTTAACAAGPIAFGVKAGVSMANIEPPEIFGYRYEFDSKLGPAAGVFANWSMNSVLGLQGELFYVSKGFSFGENDLTDPGGMTYGTIETLADLDVLEIPLLLRANFDHHGAVRVAMLAGPAVSFELRERLKFTKSINTSGASEFFSGPGIGVAVGGEMRFRTGSGWLLLEGRYTRGLNDIAERDDEGEILDRTWTFMTGYEF